MLHILRSNNVARPWWKADEYLDLDPYEKVWCSCCNAYSIAWQADARLHMVDLPIGDFGDYGNGESFLDLLSYCDEAWVEIKCADGYGCTVNPRRRASAHLRHREIEI